MTDAAFVFAKKRRIPPCGWKMNATLNRNIPDRDAFLDRAYALYETFAKSLDVACKPGCSHCCTRDVTVTTLEAYRVFKALEENGNLALIRKVLADDQRRFQPVITTNQLAELCASDGETPPEDPPVSQNPCPLLDHGLCSIYAHRPFGCRCFVSASNCGENQFADVDPFVLTVNTIFMQFIEHMDTPGLFGNFSDVLGFLDSEPHRKTYESGCISKLPQGMVFNRPIPVLMIPPEDRDRIRPLLAGLQNLRSICSL